jgi:hypothetical protein
MLYLHEFANNFIVSRIVHGQPYDRFQKITHILTIWKKLSLEFSNWFPIISMQQSYVQSQGNWVVNQLVTLKGGMAIKIKDANSHYPKNWGQNP